MFDYTGEAGLHNVVGLASDAPPMSVPPLLNLLLQCAWRAMMPVCLSVVLAVWSGRSEQRARFTRCKGILFVTLGTPRRLLGI